MRKLVLFGFSDAGYGGLPDGKSTKICVVVLGRAKRKEPELERMGWLIYSSAGKMTRVARSSLAGEVIALTDRIDYVQRLRVYLYEVFMGEFREQQLLPKDQIPFKLLFVRTMMMFRFASRRCRSVCFAVFQKGLICNRIATMFIYG